MFQRRENYFTERDPIYSNEKEISACGISGIMDTTGSVFSGEEIIRSMKVMHDRSNGLGGGFVGYGIYPEFKDFYCFHIIYDTEKGVKITEEYLEQRFKIEKKEILPHRHDTVIVHHPLLRRYFVKPHKVTEKTPNRVYEHLSEDELVFEAVMYINEFVSGAFVFSSGKDMGIFKGVGYPEDIGEFFKLEEYNAYSWIAHGRFPTNTGGWWGGAHPFGLLNFSVVHNGEISSYGINKRYLENFGYKSLMQTDTEVVSYLTDLLIRRHKLSLKDVSLIFAPPYWRVIDDYSEDKRERLKTLRIIYASALLNGPFAIIISSNEFMMGLNDRNKLRPLVASKHNNRLYIASEEAAIRVVDNTVSNIYTPRSGEPIVGKLG